MAQQTGAIYHQGILYSGGSGTNVTPNPQGEATDTLNTVEIDGTVYGIEGGGGSSLIIDAQRYSLEEQVVGIWTDGKPLYQKTFNVGSLVLTTPNTWYPTNISISANNIEQVKGIVQAVSDVGTVWDNIGLATNINDYVQVNSSRNSSGIAINFLTLIYTKATDTAGSGGYQAYGFSPIIYSDVEREVGVWRDNKPLYQKTINCGLLPQDTSWHTVPHNVSNIDVVVSVNNIVIDATNGQFTPIPASRPTLTQGTVAFVYGNNIQFMNNWLDGNSHVLYTTIQYTKASDTAGSSEYNTLAIPNVHYSTDEQVIGTWIDGKPIYQKTLVYSSGYDIGSSPITLPTTDFPEFSSVKIFINGHAYRETTSNRGTACVDIGVWKDGSSFKVQAPDTWRVMTHFTVQYTKTTD